jgi:hypothetical protein
MNVTEIVQSYLRERGFDGLYSNDAGCSCTPGDKYFPACDGLAADCAPGYKVRCRCGEGCDYDIAEDRDPEEATP